MNIFFKGIKPNKLNQKAIFSEIEAAAEKFGKDIKTELEKTTNTWNKKPVFEILTDFSNNVAVLVGTDNPIFRYVNEGTEAHWIFPVKASKLVFGSHFIPKTKPGILDSGPGEKGGDTVFSDGVLHPGIEPREFTKIIAKDFEKIFKRRMEKALKEGIKKSGHAI